MRLPRSLFFVAAGCSAFVLAACDEENPSAKVEPKPECVVDTECGIGLRCDTATGTCTECPPEIPYDGIDNDCDPSSPDLDRDGDGDNAIDSPITPGTDCDDGDPTVKPGLAEACGDARDNDCDGETDEFCIDAEDPIVTIASPTDGAILSADFDLRAVATDDFAVKSVQLFIDGQSLALDETEPYERPIRIATLTEGSHVLAALVTDTSPGAGKTARAEITIIVDTRAPTVALVSPLRDEIRGGSMTVEVDAADGAGIASVEVLSGGVAIATAPTAPYVLLIDTRTLADGPSTLTIRVTDTGGASTTLPIPVTIDNTPPVLTWLAPVAGSAHATNVLAQVAAVDVVRLVAIDLEGTIAASSPTERLVDLSATPEGVRTLTATARDASIVDDGAVNGNAATATLDLVVDRTPPTLAFVQPAAGATVSDTVALEVDAIDPAGVASVSYLDDLGAIAPPIAGPGPRFPLAWDSNRVVNGAASLRARAIDTAGNEATVTLDVVVDNAPPAVTIVRPLAGELRGGLMTVEATVIEGAGVDRVEFAIDGNVLQTTLAAPYIGTIDTRTLTDGPHDLRVESFDITGRSTAVTLAFVADNTAPTIGFVMPADGSAHPGVVSTEVQASDAIGLVEIALEGATSATSPLLLAFDGPGQPEGSRALVATARDGAIVDDVPGGNVATATITIVIDRTAPVLTLDAPAAGATLSDTVSAIATATDADGVVDVVFTDAAGAVGGPIPGPGPGFATGWDTLRVGDGPRRLTARATDAAGNFTEAFVDVTIDNAPPAIAIARPLGGERRGGLATFEATSSDPGGVARVELAVDGVVLASPLAPPFQLSVDTTTLADGAHVLAATAFDTSARSATTSVTILVDNTPPAVAFTAPLPAAIRSTTVSVTVTATDPAGLDTIDSEGSTSAVSPLVYSLSIAADPDGPRTITASAQDATVVDDGLSPGNTGSASVTIEVDNTAPVVAIVTPLAGANLRGTLPIDATATDAVGVSAVQFRISGVALGAPVAAPGPYTVSWVTTLTANGSKVVRAEAIDLAGNMGAAEVTVAVDNTAPSACALTAPAAAERVSGIVPIAGTGADLVGIDHIDYTVDGAVLAAGVGTPSNVPWDTRTASAGAHTIGAICFDASGNSRASTTRSVTVDNDPPILAITSPLAGDGVFRTTPITATATDGAGVTRVEFRVNGALVNTDTTAPYATTYDFTYDAGSATIRVDAVDSEGNLATASTVVSVVPRANFRVAELYVPVGAIATNGFAVGDVTTDGLADVVTGGASVSLLRGGAKRLLAATQVVGLATVVATQLADVDGDGDLDILALRATSLDLQRGAGDGTFAAPVSVALGAVAANSLAAGDIDGDGDLDVVVGRTSAGGDAIVLRNTGGVFAVASTVGNGGSVTDVELLDVDGDGDRDLVVGRTGAGNEKLTVFRNIGTGAFLGGQDSLATATVPLASPERFVTGDFDGDGLIEVIALFPAAAQLQRFEAGAPGNFTVVGTVATEATPSGIAAGDLDGDGDADLVVTVSGLNAIEIFTNAGGLFTSNQALFVGRGVRHPALVDLDADGDLDIVTSLSGEGSIAVVRNQGGLSFVAAGALRTSLAGVRRTPRALAIGGLSGTGLEDLAVTFDAAAPALQQVAIYEAQGASRFALSEARDLRATGGSCMVAANCPASWTCVGAIVAPPTPGLCTSTAMGAATAIALGDADGISPADLAVGSATSTGVVAAFLPRTPGVIGLDEMRNEVSPSSVAFGDPDGDDLDELFFTVDPLGAANDGVLEWNVALRAAGTRRLTGAGPKTVIVADTDDDGDEDLAVANNVTDNVTIFPSVGGVLGAPTSFAALNGIVTIGAGRVAGDAVTDLLGINGTQAVLMQGAAGGFLSGTAWAAGTSPTRLAVADFNGDGLDDVATLNATLDRVVVLHGRPQGGFFGPDEFPLGPGLFDLARGDLDRDGSPDLAVTSTTGKALGLLYNDVDKGGPLLTVLRPTAGELRAGLMTVEATLVDPTGIDRLEISVDGVLIATLIAEPWITVIDTTTLAPGGHELRLQAYDLSANTVVQLVGFDVDNTPPVVAFVAPIAGSGATGLLPINVTATDNVRLAAIEFGATTALTSPLVTLLDTTVLPEGPWTLTATARDPAIRDDVAGGNIATASISIVIDRSPPTISIEAPLPGAITGDLVAVQATANDVTGIVSLTLADSVGVFATLPGPGPSFLTSWDSTRVPSGPATLTLLATDGAGNQTTTTVVVTIDNLPPVVSVVSPLVGARRGGLATFEAASTDPRGVAQVTLDVDGVVLATPVLPPYRFVVDTRTLIDGAHTFRATSVDVSGRSAVASVAVTVDNTPPSLSFTAPVPGQHRSAFVDVSLNASDAGGLAVLSSEGRSSAASPLAYRLDLSADADGPRTLTASASDNTVVDDGAAPGNTASVSRAITVDNTPPTVALTVPAAGAALRGTVTVAATASDAIALTQVQLRAAGVALGAAIPAPGPFTASWITNSTSNGSKVVRAEAYDMAGNVGVAERTVSVDNTGPTACDITTPALNERLSGVVAFSATGADAVGLTSIELRIDGVLVATGAGASATTAWNTVLASAGLHALDAICRDAAGNTRAATTRSVSVDNDPPSLTITSPLSGLGVFRMTPITANAGDVSGVARVEFRVNGALVGTDLTSPYAATYDFTYDAGTATVRVDAIDAEGNVATASTTVTVVPRANFRVAELYDPVGAIGTNGFAIGDVTNDGLPDVVTGGATVSLLAGNAKRLMPATQLAGLATVLATQLVDVDGDGDRDLVAIRASSFDTQLRAADGSFGAPVSVALGNIQATSLATGDLDADGDLDVVIGRAAVLGDAVVLHNTGGLFAVAATYGTGGGVTDVVLADVDGDADLDLVVGHGTGISKLTVFRNLGTGSFLGGQDTATIGPPEQLRTGDFDGDGLLEIIAVLPATSQLERLEAAAPGNFTSVATIATEPSPTGLAAGDLDGDGDADLAVTVAGLNGLEIFTNAGGAFTSNQALFIGRGVRRPALADLDVDGVLDIVLSLSDEASIAVVRNQGGLSFVAAGALRTSLAGVRRTPRAVAVGALSGTGYDDFAVTFDAAAPALQQVAVYEAQGGSAFTVVESRALQVTGAACAVLGDCPAGWTCVGAIVAPPTPGLCTSSAMGVASSLAVGDADGVVPADLAVGTATTTGVVAAYLPRTLAGIGMDEMRNEAAPAAVAFGDTNGDGRDELFFTVDPALAVNDGVVEWDFALKAPGTRRITAEGPRSLLVTDTDGDGDQDLAVANNVADNVTVFPSVGGSLAAPTTFAAMNGLVSIGAGRVAGDALVDLLGVGSSQAVLMSGAPGGFLSPTVWAAGTTPSKIAVGDFNGDGLDDIATLNPGVDRVVVLHARPQGGFFGPDEFPLGPGLFDLSSGDLDRDGAPDLAVTSTTGRAVGLLVNDVDKGAPLMSVVRPSPGELRGGLMTVEATLVDATGIDRLEISVDGVVLHTRVAAPWLAVIDTSTLLDGAHELRLEAFDLTANSIVQLIGFDVDNTPPLVAFAAPIAGAAVSGSLAVNVTATDNVRLASIAFEANSSAVSPLLATVNTLLLPEGPRTLTATARDTAIVNDLPGGNLGTASISVVIDRTSSTLSIVAPLGGAVTGDLVAVQATASDPAGITMVEFSDAVGLFATVPGPGPNFPASWDSTRVPSGPATLTVRATDGAGNQTTRTVVVTIDNLPPVVSITTPLAGQRRGGLTTFTAASTDPRGVAQVTLEVDGVLLATPMAPPYRFVVDTRTLSEGTHTFRATSLDVSGRSAVASVSVTVDNTPPTLAFTAPVPGEHRSGFVDVALNASDAGGLSGLVSEGNSSPTSPLNYRLSLVASPDGPRTLTATATDQSIVDDGAVAGNVATATRAITVDNTAPTVVLTAPGAGMALRGLVTVSATASDAIGVSQVQLRGGGVALGAAIPAPGPYTAVWNTATTTNGAKIVRAEAYDAAGNVGVAELTVSVDNAAPTACDIATPAVNERLSGTVPFTATGADVIGISAIDLRIDGAVVFTSAGANATTSWNTLLATAGAHTLDAICRDASGNTRAAPARIVTVDNDAPLLTLTSPANGIGVFRTTAITATATDVSGVARVEFRLNGALIATDLTSPYATSWDFTHETGVAVIRVDAWDNEGNTSTSSVSVSVVPRAGFRVAELYPPVAAIGSSGFAVGEVTGDGFVDVLTGGGGVSLLRGGTWFRPAVAVAGLASVVASELVDVDGDGELDLVAIRGASLEVQRGIGDGTFAAPVSVALPNAPSASALALGDLDGDGDLDAVVGRAAQGGDAIVLFNTAGVFTVSATYGTGGSVTDVEIADADGDGDRDMIMGRSGAGNSKLTVFRNTGAGIFLSGQDSITAAPPEQIVTGDFDADGVLDVLALEPTLAQFEALRAAAIPGNFSLTAGVLTELAPTGIAAGDLDGDGDEDLVVTSSGINGVEIFTNAAGTFTSNQALFIGRGVRQPALVDLEGDGDLDLVLSLSTENAIAVVRNLGALNFAGAPAVRTSVGPWRRSPRAIAVGELEGGGNTDFAVTLDARTPLTDFTDLQHITVMQNLGPSTFAVADSRPLVAQWSDGVCATSTDCSLDGSIICIGAITLPAPILGDCVSSAQLPVANSLSTGNADDLAPADLAIGTAGTTGVVAAYLPRAGAAFGMEGIVELPLPAVPNYASPLWSAFGNIATGDSRDELFFTADPPNASFDGVFQYLPGGGFGQKMPTAEGPRYVVIDDADNDGDLDLAVANNITDNVTIYPGPGVTPLTQTTYSAVNGVVSIGFGHLAGDGILDLLAIGGTSAIVLQGAPGGFLPPTTSGAGTSPVRLQVGDYNGDGLDDIATLNPSLDRVVVLIARPQGGFFPPDDFPFGPGLFDLARGDLDGDGQPDLAVTSTTGKAVGLLYNDR